MLLNPLSWNYPNPNVKAFSIVVLDGRGTQRTVRLETEHHAVAYLRQTHSTEAVVAFTYDDGTPIPRYVVSKIHNQVFETMSLVTRMQGARGASQRLRRQPALTRLTV